MLVLKPRNLSTIPLEAAGLAPDRLASRNLAAIAQLPVLHGHQPAQLGDFFQISGDPADAQILIEGDCSAVKWLGSGMGAGKLTMRGEVGAHLGSAMTGGVIEVFGSVDDWCGAEMRGGEIRVHGSVGDRAAAAYPGSRRGMRGGTLIVECDAGQDLAARMRRGLVCVSGKCGPFAAAGLIAGTLVLGAAVGNYLGAGMKRGTILLLNGEPELLPTFAYDCTYRPVFLHLLLRHLRERRVALPPGIDVWNFHRYRGDLVALGLGEILFGPRTPWIGPWSMC